MESDRSEMAYDRPIGYMMLLTIGVISLVYYSLSIIAPSTLPFFGAKSDGIWVHINFLWFTAVGTVGVLMIIAGIELFLGYYTGYTDFLTQAEEDAP